MTATKASSPSSNPPPRNVFRLHGVNVLNRKNVDSISRLTALEKRRATHILDERQRRDTMNQLLAELASLVRESAAELEKQQQQLQQEQQDQQQGDALSTEQKKPPVKSNSITTLRNAIAEIRRLRSCMGLATVTPPCPASLQQPSSRSRNTSPSSISGVHHHHQTTTHNNTNSSSSSSAMLGGSCNSTPMSSPKLSYRSISPQQQPLPLASAALGPQPNYYHHHHHQQQHHSYPSSYQQQQPYYSSSPSTSYPSTTTTTATTTTATTGMQLQSPPLSPSSPSTHKHFSNSPPLTGHNHQQGSSLPSLFAGASSSYAHHPSPPLAPQYSSYYAKQQQQQQHQPSYALPPLSAVSPASAAPSGASSPSSSMSSCSPAPPLLLPNPFMSGPSAPASGYSGASPFAPL